MATRDAPDNDDAIDAREHARIRHRDRKRETPMVVDNGSLKRVAQALAEKRRREREAPVKD